MPDWIIWLVVGFIVYRFCMAGSSCGHRIPAARHGEHNRELRGGRGTPVTMQHSSAARGQRNTETPIQAAQRRFVEGTTTVEEYEAELDHALREQPSRRGQSVSETASRTSRL